MIRLDDAKERQVDGNPGEEPIRMTLDAAGRMPELCHEPVMTFQSVDPEGGFPVTQACGLRLEGGSVELAEAEGREGICRVGNSPESGLQLRELASELLSFFFNEHNE